ncbi:MAG: type II secretion system protein GspC [Woeseiaceae bacterium]|nr:type II secretion system protein GspC [Woeseiaceae bacterium]
MATEAKWSDFASRDGARTLAAVNQLLPPWVALLLVIAIGWQLAKIIWMLLPGPSVGDPVDVPAGQISIARQNSGAADVQAIVDAHIFKEVDSEAPPHVREDEDFGDLDESRANLELRGTIASEEPELSAAIIYDGANEEKVYLIGDPITSGAKLHAVLTDHVVLNENGNLTKLSLPVEFAQAAAAPVRRNTTRRRTPANTQSIQSVVSQNVARLADVIRPTPYFVNGQQQGYRVYPGRDRRQFAALGLRPGDLIKDIDGQSLTDPTQAMQIFQSLGTADQVSVTVERNGQPEVIVLKTDQLKFGEDKTQ